MEKYTKLLQFTLRPYLQRDVSTTCAMAGKRNFRKFLTYNKRGTRVVKQAQRESASPPVPVHKLGVRSTGYTINGQYMEIPEKVPELMVPNLTGCKLRPYVSYKAPDVVQSEFTSLDLFNAVYSQKVIEDFKTGKLDGDGNSLTPSEYEQLTPEEALTHANKTGTDIF